MNLETCFENIIGISTRECPCLPEKTEGWDESLSGYFVDDLEYGIPLSSIDSSKDCGDGSIWDLMGKARSEAIRDFIGDMSIMVDKANQKPFGGYMGPLANYKESHNSTLSNLSTWAGAKYSPIRYKGVTMRLTELCGFFSNTNPVEVFIYSSLDVDNAITSIVLNPSTNRKACNSLATPIDLPLSYKGIPVSYFFVYDSTDNKPRNLKWDCGCGTKPPLYSYMNGGGFNVDSLDDMQDIGGLSMYVNGLYPMVQIACDTTGWMCRDWDYKTDPFARVMANTIMYYSIMKLAGFILNSGRINFYTLIKREELFGRRASMRKKIEFNMNYLINNIPANASSCLDCDGYGMVKKTIVS